MGIVGEVSLALEDRTIIDDDDDECFQLLPNNTLIQSKKIKKCHQPMPKSSQLTICFQDGKMAFGDPIEVVIYDQFLHINDKVSQIGSVGVKWG